MPTSKPDDSCSLPIVFQILMFILYVICFVSLFKDHLELIGYGLFFVLNVIMSFGMLTNLNPSGDKNMDIGQLTYTVLSDMFNNIKNKWILSVFKDILQPFTLLNIIQNMFFFIFGIIAIILIAILGIIIAPVRFILYLVKDTGIWTGKIPISWTIIISLILLFAAFTMFLISLQNVHAKHKKMGIPTMIAFIAGGNGEVKHGYTWKNAEKGTGYYLNRGSGVNFFFSNTLVQNYATDFKIISITTVLLIWIQYLMFTNRATITSILEVNAVNGIFILNGATIVSLSSVCVWLTQRIGTLTNSIRAPPSLT